MFFCKIFVLSVATLCLSGSVTARILLQDVANVAVEEHNKYRNIHAVPHVASFSQDINSFAQEWADYLATTDQFYHSGGPFGENLYMSWGGSQDRNVIMTNAIRLWYDEIQHYDWNNPGFSGQTGHFTQVVWRTSIEIGIGIAVVPDAQWGIRAVVCVNYRPPGNFLGQFEQNVLPPLHAMDTISNHLNYTSLQSEKDRPAKVMVL